MNVKIVGLLLWLAGFTLIGFVDSRIAVGLFLVMQGHHLGFHIPTKPNP